MNIEPVRETIKNPPGQFAGDVWVDMIAVPHGPEQRAVVAKVRFAPGARTAWHSHARGQYLHVTSGVARFGTRDGNIIDVHPGQTLYTLRRIESVAREQGLTYPHRDDPRNAVGSCPRGDLPDRLACHIHNGLV